MMDKNNDNNSNDISSIKDSSNTLIDITGLNYRECFEKIQRVVESLRELWLSEERNIILKDAIRLAESFRREDHRYEASKLILETIRVNLILNQQSNNLNISDKLIINQILKLLSMINDLSTLLFNQDDSENSTELVIFILKKINISDPKERLDFYSRCRSSTGNMDQVLIYLIECSYDLLLESIKDPDKKRKAKQNLVNACLAFAFITIPAINQPLRRLELNLKGANMALDNTSLSLADNFVKQIISILIDIAQEEYMIDNDRLKAQVARQKFRYDDLMVANKEANKRKFVDYVIALKRLILNHEEEIDLKHRLSLKSLVNEYLSDRPDLLEDLDIKICI